METDVSHYARERLFRIYKLVVMADEYTANRIHVDIAEIDVAYVHATAVHVVSAADPDAAARIVHHYVGKRAMPNLSPAHANAQRMRIFASDDAAGADSHGKGRL